MCFSGSHFLRAETIPQAEIPYMRYAVCGMRHVNANAKRGEGCLFGSQLVTERQCPWFKTLQHLHSHRSVAGPIHLSHSHSYRHTYRSTRVYLYVFIFCSRVCVRMLHSTCKESLLKSDISAVIMGMCIFLIFYCINVE